jgi:hypothetical protein
MDPIFTVALTHAKAMLDRARTLGDRLQAELAENAINDILDRYEETTS